MSPTARQLLIDVLTDFGPVRDSAGRATARLFKLITKAGYHGRNQTAFTQVLRSAEADGVISREVQGRRTFAICLSDQPEPSEALVQHQQDIAAAQQRAAAVDLAALAGAVLNQALAARSETAAAHQKVLEAQERAEKAEDALRHQSADTIALETLRADLRAATARAAQATEAATVFRSRCEELDAQVAKLKQALKDSDDALAKAKSNGHNTYPFMEHLSAESRRELAEIARLMTQPPTRRG